MSLFGKERDLTQAPKELALEVDASAWGRPHAGFEIRVDSFLGKYLKWRSRTSIQDLVKSGHVLVDASTPDKPHGSGTPSVETRPGKKLHHGSKVVVVIPEPLRAPMQGETSTELDVLYEDECVLAVDKPAGLVVHPSGRHLVDTLIQRVHARYGQGLALETLGAPRLCHRLDRETSGIVITGLNPPAHADVQGQFERREVEKEYLAIVRGSPERDSGEIDAPIGNARLSRVELKMAVQADGQPSLTRWRVVERCRGFTLISAKPITGRQHQIRVHLESIGLPVVGDKLYGPDEELFEKNLDGQLDAVDLARLGLPRHALHNHRTAFRTPASGERVEVSSPLPADMVAFLAEHRR